MYRAIRTIHLCLGTFSVVFLLMYGVSAVQMAHFNIPARVAEDRVRVDGAAAKDARTLARELMDRGVAKGELQQVETTADGVRFRLQRLATTHEVSFSPASGEAHIRTSSTGVLGMLNRIHHLGGLWRDSAVLNAWGVFVGLVSAALILLGATGVYMWFKLHTERRIGGVLLAAGVGCGTLLIAWIAAA
ncbi:MAG: PepSY-associated TM helix domain-containing protein [Bryobacteraceae bacterium]|nr:PepSY-associated TM helix domain-containing protein [Bryobacteraceae bacterium]